MKISEKQATVNLKLSLTHDTTIFRNNNGALKDASGRLVQYGMGTGTSDFIGWTTKQVTPDMIGSQVAIFTAIEVKASDGKLTLEQKKFIDLVNKSGGLAKTYKGDKYE